MIQFYIYFIYSVIYIYIYIYRLPIGFPSGSVVKNPPGNAGDMGSIPGSGRSPGGRNGSPLQYSCGNNPMNITAWW